MTSTRTPAPPGGGMAPPDLAALRLRHPSVFRRSPWARAKILATVTALIGLALFALVQFDFSPVRTRHWRLDVARRTGPLPA